MHRALVGTNGAVIRFSANPPAGATLGPVLPGQLDASTLPESSVQRAEVVAEVKPIPSVNALKLQRNRLVGRHPASTRESACEGCSHADPDRECTDTRQPEALGGGLSTMRPLWVLSALTLTTCWPIALPLGGTYLGELRLGPCCAPLLLSAASEGAGRRG